MKKNFTSIFICLFLSCNSLETETVTKELSTKNNSSESETPLVPNEKALQDTVKFLKISSAYCYEKHLQEKDSFKLHEIRNYDENGRLTSSFWVNRTNTYTSVTKTFLYNGNGVLKQYQF